MTTRTEKKMILSTSDEAASIKTVTGWVCSEGRFWGEDERMARYSGCTHSPCRECDNVIEKNRTICNDCATKRQVEKFNELPTEEWDGKDPICLYDDDAFFFDFEGLFDYCHDQGLMPSELMLTDTRPEGLCQIDEDHFCDELPEDGELPDEVAVALEALNKVIRETPSVAYWMNGKKRILVSDDLMNESK